MKKVQLVVGKTPLYKLNSKYNNDIYIKRDDMTGLAFGGNKARKLEFFMGQVLENSYDYIVTYGSIHSNHCIMTAAAASILDIPCLLILAQLDDASHNHNNFLHHLFNAEVAWTKKDQVNNTIEYHMKRLRDKGKNPYFIPGGGHGNCGVQGYVEAYNEIEEQKKELNISFDYIFLASGTGTTQAGLIIGNHFTGNETEKIIGISIARNELRGKEEIFKSIKAYNEEFALTNFIDKKKINFIDDYICGGYGDFNDGILKVIKEISMKDGIILDPVYTGKAFWGMLKYLGQYDIKKKKILFIHTGGIPLVFSHSDRFK
ncbi:pyridoxal-phosphate dependent enzyme [Clostridium sp. D2Q-11]|uniref:Pyridoxal-phosphate dependent enzyme n=1 Tax=Anaeromonas frigoriresistens TaxID=2683708 RepID=A0A942Z977_9FIRM|nr:pyridoxal-phosphate dependent enzyme [Anaeromonas frigoriresistens]